MDDHLDEMIDINTAFHDKDLVRIMLLKAGICDHSTLSNIEFADNEAIEKLWVNIVISDEFNKLVQYLRS